MGHIKYRIEDMIGNEYGNFRVLRYIRYITNVYEYKSVTHKQKSYMFRVECLRCGKRSTRKKNSIIYRSIRCKCQPRKKHGIKAEARFTDKRNDIYYTAFQLSIIVEHWHELEKYKNNKYDPSIQYRRFHPERFPKCDVYCLPYNVYVPHRLTKKILTEKNKNLYINIYRMSLMQEQ